MHPGHDTKTSQSIPLRRIYLLTYILTWVYLETAINAVANAHAHTDLSNRESLCQLIMSSADARLTDAGFWRTFEDAKTELRSTWQLSRVKDPQKKQSSKSPTSNQPRKPQQVQSKAYRHPSTFSGKSIEYEWADESFIGPTLGSIIRSEPMDLIENPIEYRFFNLSVDDVLEKRFNDEPSLLSAPPDISVVPKPAKAPSRRQYRKSKKAQTKADRCTSAFSRRSTDHKQISGSLNHSAPGLVVEDEPLNLIENPTKYQSVNLSMDDSLEKSNNDRSLPRVPLDTPVAPESIQSKDLDMVLPRDVTPASRMALANESVGLSLEELSRIEGTYEKPAKGSVGSRSLTS